MEQIYRLLIVVVLLVAVCTGTVSAVVDEPLGANYSLGMTLWHLGHNAGQIRDFHDYLKSQNLSPDKVLDKKSLTAPKNMVEVLIEPELLPAASLNGWNVSGENIVSHGGDQGPIAEIPLSVPRSGLYRLWIKYYAEPGGLAVTSVRIYRMGQEQLGPIVQPDELYDKAPEQAGPQWKEMLLDLDKGDYIVQIGHLIRHWRGAGSYLGRSIDCLYLTDRVWLPAPEVDKLSTLKQSAKQSGAQWTNTSALSGAELKDWKWWQVRPLSWEDSAANPKLFALSRKFQSSLIDDLSKKTYPDSALPDYREPERQVVYNETWNILANPVRAKRQIDTLSADISRKPLGYNYVWHDVGSNIEGLKPEGGYEPGSKYASYGGWSGGPGMLMAGWGTGTGRVSTTVSVGAAGKYAVWVLSDNVNLSYTAPYYGIVSADGKEQINYYHKGNIASLWMKMGEVQLGSPGPVKVDFVLDSAEFGTTYRRIYKLFLIDDLNYIPQGTIRPPWDMDIYKRAAKRDGATDKDKLLVWISPDPYRPLSQEVWADKTSAGDSWPFSVQKGQTRNVSLLMAGNSSRAVRVALRSLTDSPQTLNVVPGPLKGSSGSFPAAVTWRVETFVPYGNGRQDWTGFFLMRRPSVTVPPLNVAGVWLTVSTKGVPAGNYKCEVKLSGKGVAPYSVLLNVRVLAIKPAPRQSVLVDGWTPPHEGSAYLSDFVEHGMNVWPGEMSKADMKKWGIKLIRLSCWSADAAPDLVKRIHELGLDYDDYFVGIMDEPSATTEEALKPYIDVAKAIKAIDPKIRVCFNPSEAAQLATFQVLAPYCDFWCPYALHLPGPNFGNSEKQAIYEKKPWMWYTTPCMWDKTAREPGIRSVPSKPGDCVGVAFFALNYPWRDQWDTGYEHIADASTMGAVVSRHGPVATIVWEQIREASQTANLAMMVREALGVTTFDQVKDPKLQQLIQSGTQEELLLWLENKNK